MAERPSDDNRDMWRAYQDDGSKRWPRLSHNPTDVLATDIAAWLADNQDPNDYITDAYDLIRTLRARGWQFSAALGRADFTGRVPTVP